MALVKTSFPDVSKYNKIPFIHDMEHVAQINGVELNHLRDLLDKHNIPDNVKIKLLHIHYHLQEGEILAVTELATPLHGSIPFLAPTKPDPETKVYGCHYYVDDEGNLQAYEYTTLAGGIDLAAHPAFVGEFCTFVVKHELQHKFGLAVTTGVAQHGSWTELDWPEKRATFLLPNEVSIPQSDQLISKTTITQFASPTRAKEGQTHAHTEHYHETDKAGEHIVYDGVTTQGGLRLAGIPLDPSTAFHSVASAIAMTA